MRISILACVLLSGLALLMSSCGTNGNRATSSPDNPLPAGYSIANIASALDEYINYVLWSNPVELYPKQEGDEPFIGQKINVEVRLYTDPVGNHKVYARTDVIPWEDSLSTFDILGGVVYSIGQVTPQEEAWPKGEYEVIDNISIEVKPIHEPRFGSSPRKDRMILVVENKLEEVCKDFSSGSERGKWLNSDIYVINFFEYEHALNAWLIRKDEYAWNQPLAVESGKTNGEFIANSLKGYAIDNLLSMGNNDPGRFWFDKQMKHAVKHYVCTESGLKPA